MTNKILRILFQGDSVTDEERDRSDPHHLGKGHAKFTAELLREHYGERKEFEFINLGISGNKSEDLYERWQEDCIALKPDIVCFMVGINDVWHCYNHGLDITPEQYGENCEKMFVALQEKTDARLVVMEPFLLDNPEKPFRERLDPNIDKIRALSFKYADEYVPLDGLMTAAAIHFPKDELTYDGVHPREKGARIIARFAADAIISTINKCFADKISD